MSLLQIPSRKCLVTKQCLQLLQYTQEAGPGNGECQKKRGYSGYYQCLHTCLDVNETIQELPGQRYESSEHHKGKHTARIVRDTIDVEIFAAFLKCRNRFTNSPHLRNTETGVVAEGSVNVVRSMEIAELIYSQGWGNIPLKGFLKRYSRHKECSENRREWGTCWFAAPLP